MPLIDANINTEIDITVCSCCCLHNKKKIKINYLHENCAHTDFGPGFLGIMSGKCSLGNKCVAPNYPTWNRGCNKCKQRIHEGECMVIHRKERLEEEKNKWIRENIDLVEKHYDCQLKDKKITLEEYNRKMDLIKFK